MNRIVLEFANGNSLFVGLPIAVAACALSCRLHGTVLRSVLRLLAITGGLMVVLSATPFPVWVYVVWSVGLLACLAATAWRPIAVVGLLIVSVVMALVEMPYHRASRLPFPKDKPLVVIADSIGLALENNVAPWPEVLAKTTGRRVRNLAFGGLKVEGALSSAKSIRADDVAVLLEIGGNDLLLDSTVSNFDTGLRALLTEVCQPGRVVAMLELPLPPFFGDFGRIQRRYAKEFGVILIPKRCLAQVLGTPRATIDGLHLSGVGHRQLAALLNEMIE